MPNSSPTPPPDEPHDRIRGVDIGLPMVSSVGTIRSRSAHRIAWHSHEDIELIFLTEGATAYEFAGTGDVELAGGQFLFTPSHTRHRGRQDVRMPSELCGIQFQPSRRHAHLHTTFTRQDLRRMDAQCQHTPMTVRSMSRELQAIIAQLMNESDAFTTGRREQESLPLLRGLTCMAIGEALRQLSLPTKPRTTDLIAAAEAFLRQHHDEPIQMPDLAAHLGLSRARMFEAFKSTTGLTPNDYLQRHRISRACELLAGGNRSITDITFKTGFSSSQYFCKVFRKYCGVTPGEYRSKHARRQAVTGAGR